MCVRGFLGFVLLVWFPGALRAQSAAQPCRAARLNDGYLVPEQDSYAHETTLSYSCDEGFKPVVEGWWATSTCLNGTWSHEPQCIDKDACLPPAIPNAESTVNTAGWYEEGHIIRITCDEGYEHKRWDATAECVNGTWTSVPICEKSVDACGEPPQVPHAVIINVEYQEVYPADAEVQYGCKDGYSVEAADTKESIYCIAGNWTEGPTCSRRTRPGPGLGGSGVGGTGGGTTPSTGSVTPPAGGGSGAASGDDGSTSAGTGTKPVGGGSSDSESDKKETSYQITTVNHCGKHPVVPNGDVVGKSLMYVRYQCADFYTHEGPEAVVCFSDGSWSEAPTCKAEFCRVNIDEYPQLIPAGVKYLRNGETERFECVHLQRWWTTHYSVGRCRNGRLTLSKCCGGWELVRGVC